MAADAHLAPGHYAAPEAPPGERDAPARPRAWIAVLLGLVGPGAGHVYAGLGWRSLRAVVIQLAGLMLALQVASHPWMSLLVTGLTALAVALDVARFARAPGATRPALTTVCAGLVAFTVLGWGMSAAMRVHVADTFRIPAGGMAPELLPGDIVLVDKLAYSLSSPRHGEVIVFRSPEDGETLHMMRVIGAPGDRIRTSGSTVWLNGAPLERATLHRIAATSKAAPAWLLESERLPDGSSYQVLREASAESESESEPDASWTVPQDGYFVLGDNRAYSHDSRRWANPFVAREDVIGRAVGIYWSSDPTTGRARPWRVGPLRARSQDELEG